MALSADSRGRLVFHNVSGYLSLTAMLAGATLFLGVAILQQLQTWKAHCIPVLHTLANLLLQKQAQCVPQLHCCCTICAGRLVLLPEGALRPHSTLRSCSSYQEHEQEQIQNANSPAHLLRLRCRPPWKGQPACHAAGRAQAGADWQPGAPAPPEEQPAHRCSRGRPCTAVPRPDDPECCSSAPLQQCLCVWPPFQPCWFVKRTACTQ